MLAGMWRKGNSCTLMVGIAQPLWKTAWNFLKKKTKTELSYDPVIPLLGIYVKKKKNTLIQKGTIAPTFIAALFTVAKIWKHLNVHQQMNGSSRRSACVSTHIRRNTAQPQKRRKFCDL